MIDDYDHEDDELLPPEPSQEAAARRRGPAEDPAMFEWSSVDDIRARLSASVRLRGPLTVRQTSPATWTVEGGTGIAAVCATAADADLVAHSASDALYLLWRMSGLIERMPARRTAA